MPTEFRDLSPTAQHAIVDCMLGEPNTNLPEDVKDEIRDWATPTEREMPPDVEVIRGELLKSIRHEGKDESFLNVSDHLDLYGVDEWVLGSNFEDGTHSLVRKADESWWLRDPFNGDDSPVDDPLCEARYLLFG